MQAPAEVSNYNRALAQLAGRILGDDLIGVYTTGSLALGDFVAGRSDIDLLAVAEDGTAGTRLAELAHRVEHPDLWCPAAGLELVVIGRSAARKVPFRADFLLEVNTGREIRHLVNFDPGNRPAFWYLLDREIARQSGDALAGPPVATVISPVPRKATLAAIAESLDYQSAHLGESLADSAILNACRSLRFVRENRWYSKPAAGRWAMTVPGVDTRLLARALEAHRQGRDQAGSIATDAARGFIDSVRSLIRQDANTDTAEAQPTIT